MYSALVVVYTAYCALQIVLLALHYIAGCKWCYRLLVVQAGNDDDDDDDDDASLLPSSCGEDPSDK